MAKEKVKRQDILRAAAQAIERYGLEGFNARSVAKVLGCSTQPIYSQFGSMEGLISSLKEEAAVQYGNKIKEYLTQEGRVRYEAYGMGFVKFAAEEKGLYRLLYHTSRESEGPPRVEDPYLGDIISEIKNCYGMDEQTAKRFHADMAVYSCGLAGLVNADSLHLTEEEISAWLKRQFYALYALYYPDKAQLMHEFAEKLNTPQGGENFGKSH